MLMLVKVTFGFRGFWRLLPNFVNNFLGFIAFIKNVWSKQQNLFQNVHLPYVKSLDPRWRTTMFKSFIWIRSCPWALSVSGERLCCSNLFSFLYKDSIGFVVFCFVFFFWCKIVKNGIVRFCETGKINSSRRCWSYTFGIKEYLLKGLYLRT